MLSKETKQELILSLLEIEKGNGSSTLTLAPQNKPVIAILQRGWVVTGVFSQNGPYCKLKNASVIRKWGTNNGLGELAEKGKLPNTVLDKTKDITFHELTCVAIIEMDKEL